MKKLVSFIMTAAMVAAMLPATAFAAAGEVSATAKILGAKKLSAAEAATVMDTDAAELQLKVTNVAYKATTNETPVEEVTISLSNATFLTMDKDGIKNLVVIKDGGSDNQIPTVSVKEVSKDEVTFVFEGKFEKDDIIAVSLQSLMTRTNTGRTAAVSIESDMLDVDGLVYATVVSKGVTASIRKIVDVAAEEVTALESRGLTIKSDAAGTYLAAAGEESGTIITLKLNRGFAFVNKTLADTTTGVDLDSWTIDGGTATFVADADDADINLKGIKIEAVSAKVGATATITVRTNGVTAAVDVARVVDYQVSFTTDADEDVPVIFSGVNVKNDGITDDSNHMSLEVTAEETFPGAWSMRQGFKMDLSEGVYVTNVQVIAAENFYINDTDATDTDWEQAFFDAYQRGNYTAFEFNRRVFDDVNTTLAEKPAKITFKLELVADPNFEGDVELTLEGALLDTQAVTIAQFVKPYEVVAEQNDLVIDYRFTVVPTNIEVKETADGLWAKDARFDFSIEKALLEFESNPTILADEDSAMELKDTKANTAGAVTFKVKSESDSAATVTVSDMELFMQRNIPAGPYALEMASSLVDAYLEQALFAAGKNANNKIADVTDYSSTVKEAFINVITSGRDQDDASFTTKVVVPVGENYLIAGQNTIDLDVPAYITESGYTMLPIRAVANALGVNTNAVLWNQEAKTVTILYGQRIITMTVGDKTVYVNGSAIPASAEVEVTNDRAFLPMRDLATALGVTDIAWDAETRTATLNGNQR